MIKKNVLLAFVLVLFSTSILGTRLVIPANGSTTHDVYPGQSIQEAINSAHLGDTIFVHAGIYYENVNVNKSVSLVGEHRSLTIVDGNGTGKVIYIAANNVSIRDFTIRKSGTMLYDCGIWVQSINNSISHNTIANNNLGVVTVSSYNSIHSNNITDNIWGIGLGRGSKFNSIFGNIITQNQERGISLYYSSNNTISGNNITNNVHGIYLDWSSNNIIHYNNFVDNGKQVLFYVSKNNFWDDGAKGNYWGDYEERYPNAEELDDSGIWDTPYVIDENNIDRYPLMPPPDTTPPAISILSPENKTYPVKDVPLTYIVSESTSWIGHSLDGQANVTITGNTTLSGLSDGSHRLIVYAKDTAGNTGASEITYFSTKTQAEPFPLWIVGVVTVVVIGTAITTIFLWRRRARARKSF